MPGTFIIALVIGLVIGWLVRRARERQSTTILPILQQQSAQRQSQENGVLSQGTTSQAMEIALTGIGVTEKNDTQISRQTSKK